MKRHSTMNYARSKQNERRRTRTVARVRLRRMFEALERETRNYFHETSLHGFKYIISSESTIFEKLMWSVACATGMVFCVILMLLAWRRFELTPTVTTIDTTTHPIWELPFPAVTICNFNKIYQPQAILFTEELKKVGLNDTEIEHFLQSLPKLIRPEYIDVDFYPGMKALNALGYTIEQLMQYLMQPCDKLLVRCAWVGQLYNCSKMFRTIKSTEGFCCSFNYHALIDTFQTRELAWGNKTGEKPSVPQNKPHRVDSDDAMKAQLNWIPGVDEILMVAGSGRDVGLSVVFDPEGHLYSGATRPYIAASILIHDPEDYPEISLLSAVAEPGQEIDMAITGTIIESVANVRPLSIEHRRCWFDDEAHLKSYNAYSYQTCITECRIEHILKLCNCLPFYYPAIYPNFPTCTLSDVKCMRAYRRVLSSLQTPIDVDTANVTIDNVECYCLPQCSDKWYSLNTESANLATIKYDAPMLKYYSHGLDIRNLSLMYVYFRDITCLKYRRDILMTWDGLFASFGGIFGLCLGGSVLSLIELFYYFWVRVFHRNANGPTRCASSSRKRKSEGTNKRKIGILPNTRLNNLDILKDQSYYQFNNFKPSDVGTFFKRVKRFDASDFSKHYKVSENK